MLTVLQHKQQQEGKACSRGSAVVVACVPNCLLGQAVHSSLPLKGDMLGCVLGYYFKQSLK